MKILSDSSTMKGPTITSWKKGVGIRKGPKKRELLLYRNQCGTKYLEDKKWWRQLDRSHYEGKSCEYEQISYASGSS
jgi:hypothetical protein